MEEINLGGGSKIYYKRKLIEDDESNEMYKKLFDNDFRVGEKRGKNIRENV